MKKIEFHRSIVFKMIIVIIAAVLPINIMSIVMSNYSNGAAQQQIFDQAENVLTLYVTQLDLTLDRLDNNLLQIALNNQDFSYLLSKDISANDDPYRYARAQVKLINVYKDLTAEDAYIEGLFAYFPEKDLKLRTVKDNMPEKLAAIDQVIAMLDTGLEGLHWQIIDISGENYLINIYKRGTAYYGATMMLEEVLTQWGINEATENIYTFADSQNNLKSARLSSIAQLNAADLTYSFNGQTYNAIRSASTIGDYQLVQLIPQSGMMTNIPFAIWLLQIISLFFLLAIPFILFVLNRFVLKPVNKLTEAMRQIEAGDADFRIKEYKTQSEFDQINLNFNHMMDQMKMLRFDVYEGEIERQKIRMRYLTQQIQPHFILNTLNILYSYEPEEYPQIQKMILLLTRYFRYIVKVDLDFVEVAQELNHIRDYYELQLTRYPGKYHYSVTCEEGLEHQLLPPLIIQNFAENIIKYALNMDMIIDIDIQIASLDSEHLQISIADTGAGMPADVLSQIEVFKQTHVYQPAMGIGIQNAIERLELLYYGKASITFGTNENGHGTRVVIVLPKSRKEVADPV